MLGRREQQLGGRARTSILLILVFILGVKVIDVPAQLLGPDNGIVLMRCRSFKLSEQRLNIGGGRRGADANRKMTPKAGQEVDRREFVLLVLVTLSAD